MSALPATDDPYRSRFAPRWEAGERVDPVVYGDGTDGPLDAAQVERFATDGYLALPEVLTATEVQQALDEARATAEARAHTEEVVAEPGSDVVRSLFRVHRTNAFLQALAADERLAGVARQLLGGDVYLHQTRVNYKPALDGREFFWHSDFETWHIEDGMPRMRCVSVSISLTLSTEFNGPLMLAPGSHRIYVRCVGETPP